ncbi:glycosyltransferase family 39 protein [Sphingomicrobium aestuariivivum]|uniref:glycosyltransferase family 39 protein n=1 Tax=Sphingomicrobium aestuariivivum TaxID=1582356 RepID=UPI001FD67DB6|nr:glycosyltransferase family 39 protein [Sphingomicrobium aestuariivivum]MCJ8190132.1 glycosyltransferase family 39 protein [Sphingomicrobium aestuariivivum]
MQRSGRMPVALAVLALTLLGALIRWAVIGREALWIDEAFTPLVSMIPVADLFGPADPSGPVYYLVQKFVAGSAADPVSLRLSSLVAGTVLIPVAALLGGRLAGPVAAVASAALVALSPPLVDYSVEARGYMLLALLLTANALALVAAEETVGRGARRLWLLLFAVTGGLALMTHLAAFPVIGLSSLWLLLSNWRRSSAVTLLEAGTTLLPVVAVGLAELHRMFVYERDSGFLFSWLEQFGLVKLLAAIGWQWLPATYGAPLWLAALALLVVAGGAIWMARGRIRAAFARGDSKALVMAGWLSLPLWLWLTGFLIKPVVMSRTVLPVLPAALVLAAVGIAALRGRARGVAVLLASVATLGGFVTQGPVREREDWYAVREALLAREQATVVVCPYWKGQVYLANMPAGWRRAAVLREGFEVVDARSSPTWTREARAMLYGPSDGAAKEASRVTARERLFVIKSMCSPEEEALIAQAFGLGAPASVWHAPVGTEGADPGLALPYAIRIEEYRLDRPVVVGAIRYRP